MKFLADIPPKKSAGKGRQRDKRWDELDQNIGLWTEYWGRGEPRWITNVVRAQNLRNNGHTYEGACRSGIAYVRAIR